MAGKRAGLEGKRSTLWSEFARIIRELKPGWVLVENVPGLLSSDGGRFFGGILRDLAESGYDAEWNCISAAAFGAPHRRERVFFIAYSNGERCGYPSKRFPEIRLFGGLSSQSLWRGMVDALYVEWMMGLPLGWIDLEASEMP